MPCCKNGILFEFRYHQISFVLVLFALVLGSAPVHAEGVYVRSAASDFDGQRYRLSANIDYHLSKTTLDALHNGVPVRLRVDVEVLRKRSYWLDELIAELNFQYELSYKPLSQTYLVRNINSGAIENFVDYDQAVTFAGWMDNVPLLDNRLLSDDELYIGHLRAVIDRAHYPFALRMWSHVRASWRFESDWYQWLLKE